MPFAGQPPREIILAALCALARLVDVRAVSNLYSSPAWPDPSDPPFVNAAARLSTSVEPEALLAMLHAVEAGFGRVRGRRNGPRTLDLDLLDFDGQIRAADDRSPLVLPHPRLAERDFMLIPLREIAPEWRQPGSGATAGELLKRLGTPSAMPLDT